MRKRIKLLLVSFILVIAVAATIHLFDWKAVLHSLSRTRVGLFLGFGIPVIAAIFALRGLRWLVVLAIPFSSKRLWLSACANGAAAGLASLTPFQLGEVVKVRLIPDQPGSAWRLGVSGLLVERILDLSGLLGVGLFGLAIHLGYAWASPLALALPALSGLILTMLARHLRALPQRAQPYLAAFHNTGHILATSLLTIPLWLLYATLWWMAAESLHVSLTLAQTTTMLGGTMLAIVASMTPGGLGVSELSSRGILLWLGLSTTDADTTAIALRLLTPLIVAAGLCCVPPLLKSQRTSQGEATSALPIRGKH